MDSLAVKIGASLCALLLIFEIEDLYGRYLFDESQILIRWLQRDVSDLEKNLWKFHTNFALLMLLTKPLIISYALIEQRSRCCYYLFVYCAATLVTSSLKLLIH